MSNDKNGRAKLRIIISVALVIIFAILLVRNPELAEEIIYELQGQNEIQEVQPPQQDVIPATGALELTMIDVGQGDSFLFVQEGKAALVDCGTRGAGDIVVDYLKSRNITRLDYVFGTHPHDDHMGGMYDVITNFEIGTIVLPEVEPGKVTTNWYIKLMDEIVNGDYKLEYAEVGKSYNLGQARMEVIGPYSVPKDNLNNYSTVMRVSFGEMDVIMTGDAEKEVERQILENKVYLDSEILKVGHHGSDTSTSTEFLEAISPDYALISCKVGNKYHHPVQETIQKFEERNIEVYRTDECGTVTATITSSDVTFNTAPGDYLNGPELEERSSK